MTKQLGLLTCNFTVFRRETFVFSQHFGKQRFLQLFLVMHCLLVKLEYNCKYGGLRRFGNIYHFQWYFEYFDLCGGRGGSSRIDDT